MAAAAPVFFASAADFRAWLLAHAAHERELQVGFHKVGSGRPSMTWPESVDEALCVGWIDGVRKRVDEHTYTIRFTPRKPGSIWSAINIDKVQRLQAEGRMTAAGLQAFAQRTEARSVVYSYEQEKAAELLPAEVREFKRHQAAWAYFEACPPGYRHQMLYRVTSAKKPETRKRRLDLLIAACSEGRRLR